ncbi:MAG: DUF2905 domain-containing protein [Bacteroidales bacterium]|nr:DUF2905 domain-containing protein [Bacteroidales bacterium]
MKKKYMARWIIVAGIALVILGLIIQFFPWAVNWFGKLPGDIRIENENTKFYFPVVSMLIVSAIITLLVNIPRIIKLIK